MEWNTTSKPLSCWQFGSTREYTTHGKSVFDCSPLELNNVFWGLLWNSPPSLVQHHVIGSSSHFSATVVSQTGGAMHDYSEYLQSFKNAHPVIITFQLILEHTIPALGFIAF
jgi:hypothetical protein